MKGLGLKLLKIHLLFLAFLPLFIDRSIDGKNGTKTRENPVLVQMCAPVQTIYNKNIHTVYIYPGIYIRYAVLLCAVCCAVLYA